ncbi:MAG: glycoside hydrolase family 2, partial [Planctomycetota bacterium]
RWTGTLEVPASGRYTFRTRNDDGVRMWIDGKVVIDHWKGEYVVSERRGEIDLVAGKPVTFKVEYFNGGDIGVLQLFWTSPGRPEEIIPASRFRSP